jgi:GntR family transcriptional regulator
MPIAAALQIRPGQLVGYLRRLRYADGQPVGIDYRYIVGSTDQRLDDSDVMHETIWEVLEKKLGMMNIKSSVTIRATAARAEDAVLLKIPPASPVLHREFHLVNMPDEPILIGHSIYHPDRFIHATTVRRSRQWNLSENLGRDDGMPP